MLTITNINKIKGKHFGDKNMRVWQVDNVLVFDEHYHFLVSTKAGSGLSSVAWFRLDRTSDRVGSHMLVKGEGTKSNSMAWLNINDINNMWHLCTKFSELI